LADERPADAFVLPALRRPDPAFDFLAILESFRCRPLPS
jgi:hypothetical protein